MIFEKNDIFYWKNKKKVIRKRIMSEEKIHLEVFYQNKIVDLTCSPSTPVHFINNTLSNILGEQLVLLGNQVFLHFSVEAQELEGKKLTVVRYGDLTKIVIQDSVKNKDKLD